MPKTKAQKKELVKDIATSIKKAKSIAFIDTMGLEVKNVTQLRKDLKKEKADMKVLKKSLMKLAFKDVKGETKIEYLETAGPKTAVFCYEDEVSPVKNIYLFSRKHKTLKLRAGILGDKQLDAKEILELATLPSKQELLASVVGSIAAPVSGFVGVLSANLRNLVYALSEISKQTKK